MIKKEYVIGFYIILIIILALLGYFFAKSHKYEYALFGTLIGVFIVVPSAQRYSYLESSRREEKIWYNVKCKKIFLFDFIWFSPPLNRLNQRLKPHRSNSWLGPFEKVARFTLC